MGYEVFNGKWNRTGILPCSTARIAVNPSGRITLNSKSVRLLGLPRWVALLWDDESSRLAIKATTPDDPNGYSLNYPNGSGSAQLNSRAFWSFVGGNVQPQSLDAEYDHRAGLLAVSLPAR